MCHTIKWSLTLLSILLHIGSLGLFVTNQSLQDWGADDFKLWLLNLLIRKHEQ